MDQAWRWRVFFATNYSERLRLDRLMVLGVMESEIVKMGIGMGTSMARAELAFSHRSECKPHVVRAGLAQEMQAEELGHAS